MRLNVMLFCFLILKNLKKNHSTKFLKSCFTKNCFIISFNVKLVRHFTFNWNFLNVLHEVKISILHENDLYHPQISIYAFMASLQLKPACLSEVLDCIVPYIIQTKQYSVIVLLRR